MKNTATAKNPPAAPLRFRALLESTGKTAAGMQVPEEIVTRLGSTKRPAVKVTINGYTYRSSIAPMGGAYWLGVSNENRAKAGVAAGQTLDVTVELDTEPRAVTVPADFQKALGKDAAARKFFEGLSHSNKSRIVLAIEGAKTAETRQRRIEKSVAMLHEGKSQ
jgi:hypothetical protein